MVLVLIIAIFLTMLALIVDYCNPAIRWIEIIALLIYVPAARAWVKVLHISSMAGIVNVPILRFILWTVCIVLTCAIAASTAFRMVPVIRMVATPVSDAILGLGTVKQQDVNQRMIGVVFAASALTSFSAGGAAHFVDAINNPLVAAGDYIHKNVAVNWIGYGK